MMKRRAEVTTVCSQPPHLIRFRFQFPIPPVFKGVYMFAHPSRSLIHPCSSQTILTLLLLVCIGGSGCGLGTLASLSQAKPKNAGSVAGDPTNHAGATALNVVPDLNADASKNLNAYENYSAQIRVYLDQENFDQIDAIADAVRSQKSRFAGGAWKLQKVYRGLREPANGARASDTV